MKFILFILIIKNVLSQIIINNPKILEINFYNNFSNSASIELNNIRYRESSILPNQNGLFLIYLKQGIYNLNNLKNLNYKLYNGKKVGLSIFHLKDKIISNDKWNILDKINYQKFEKHKIFLRFIINVVELKGDIINYDLKLKINNNIYNFENITKNSYIIKMNNIEMNEGNNTIIISSISKFRHLCSCPSINDGFYSGRNLFVWYAIKKNDTNLVTYNIKFNKNNNKSYQTINIIYDLDYNFKIRNSLNNYILYK